MPRARFAEAAIFAGERDDLASPACTTDHAREAAAHRGAIGRARPSPRRRCSEGLAAYDIDNVLSWLSNAWSGSLIWARRAILRRRPRACMTASRAPRS